MEIRGGRFRFTLRDILVLFVVVALLLALLAPAINAAREAARRAACVNRLQMLGLAFHSYHGKHQHFPASSGVTRNPDGSIRAVDGWSFVVRLLPYMEYSALYNTMDVPSGKPLVEPTGGTWAGTPHADAANTRIAELLCPSNPHPSCAAGPGGTGWVTNYKAMGATHVESLLVASPTPTVPLYDPDSRYPELQGLPSFAPSPPRGARHPDGALYPGTDQTLSAFGREGTAHTILLAETMDPGYGVWTVGAECTLVGLPSEQPNEQGEIEPLRIELYNNSFYAPAGFNNRYGEDAPPAIRRLKPYLAYDFQRADPGPYVGGDPRAAYGPSSGHPAVVNHLFADGTVRSISRLVDFTTYMFQITRYGKDPTGVFICAP